MNELISCKRVRRESINVRKLAFRATPVASQVASWDAEHRQFSVVFKSFDMVMRFTVFSPRFDINRGGCRDPGAWQVGKMIRVEEVACPAFPLQK